MGIPDGAELQFKLLKRERIKRHTCPTRADARAELFDYIELFCSPVGTFTVTGK